MTTPILPEVASVSTFGGPFSNKDSVVDPETECDASFFNLLLVQLTMAGYTVPRAWARCTIAAAAITLADHSAVWGDTTGVKPTVARTSAGLYTVTWASTYDDLQATPETHSFAIRAVLASGANGTTAAIVNATFSGNVVTVRGFDAAGVAAELTEFTVEVR